jgi:tetratricopeptide (TPR) repeat protein
MRKKVGIILLSVSLIGILAISLYFDYQMLRYLNHKRIDLSIEYLRKAEKEPGKGKKLLYYELATTLNSSENNNISSGKLALEMGNQKLASVYLSRVRSSDGYKLLGDTYFSLAEYDNSIKAYRKSLEMKQTEVTRAGLISAYLGAGKTESAKSEIQKYLYLTSDNLSMNDLAVLLGILDKSDYTNNQQVNRITIEKDNNNRNVLIYNELNRLGFPQAANDVLIKAGKNGLLTRDGYIELGNYYFLAGDYPQSQSYYLKAKEIDPYYPQVYKHLYEVSLKLQKDEDAKSYNDYYNSLTW